MEYIPEHEVPGNHVVIMIVYSLGWSDGDGDGLVKMSAVCCSVEIDTCAVAVAVAVAVSISPESRCTTAPS